MIKRPKRGETEDDILRMQEEFLSQKAKNPKLQSAAQIIKVEKAPKKSLFAKNREKAGASKTVLETSTSQNANSVTLLGEIHEKIVGDVQGKETSHLAGISDIVLGDIVEKQFTAPKEYVAKEVLQAEAFPKVVKSTINVTPRDGKSIFALSMEANTVQREEELTLNKQGGISAAFGQASVLVEDTKTGAAVHKENMELLNQMKTSEILDERKKLLESIDPSLIAYVAKRRQEKIMNSDKTTKIAKEQRESMDITSTVDLEPSNAAIELLERSGAENWIHFDVVEKDKLEWMHNIPAHVAKLKPGAKFEARFDWKGVLLPYSTEDRTTTHELETRTKDERELYLHGEEPHRPGYTLQELFRLARSNVMQQRVSAFGAIGGILSIYNQGFYDQVLELPITKMFFLLRLGLDDNTPAMLEVVSKALATLLYNETDETLLDFIFDNPSSHWQPTLQAARTDYEADDPTSVENLQKQMKQLRMNISAGTTFKASVEESQEESSTSMSDFQLAETDLMDCLLRTNILKRIYFILQTVRADNSTVISCLKVLIRMARTGKEVAMQIVSNDELVTCLLQNFLPGMECVDITQCAPVGVYGYPQHLCLKLVRVLVAQNLCIAVKFVNLNIVEKLQNYLYNREDINGKMIKVQIEALRLLRCLLLLRVDNNLCKKFANAFRYMLEWHYNHVIYDEGGPFLIRQHAAALLAAITSVSSGLEVTMLLGDLLHDCCCNWFHRASRHGVKEFSQATLLSTCLNAVAWHSRQSGDGGARFRSFRERYLCDFIAAPTGLVALLGTLVSSSIVLRKCRDRRNVHPPLPNVGAVIMHKYGPQLIVPQTYGFHLLSALWRLLELQLEGGEKSLLHAFIQPQTVEPLVNYLRVLGRNMNEYLATNFYAKTELRLIFKLLCFEGFRAYFEKAQMLQLVYNFLCCLTAEHIPEIEKLFERVIFNEHYIDVDASTLKRWQNTCLELVYSHYIVVPPTELTLSLRSSQSPILPHDWPYFQLKIILKNYLENVQQKPAAVFSEREVIHMTFTFVAQLEQCNPQLQIVSPTEKLMYLMIAFMGPDSQFLEKDMQELLRQHIQRFYEQCRGHTFQFDGAYEGKCKFENLYALFVDHFQAASYGDELFGSLVLVPLAQKYDNKWRRRVWSDYVAALRFLNCDESLLLGGLQAYLEPAEEEDSLLKAYATALNTNLVRAETIPYKIAKFHVEKYNQRLN